MMPTKISFLLIILSFLVSFNTKGQENDIIIKGILIDSLSNKFINEATIKVIDSKNIITKKTINNGLFFFKIPKSNSIELEFTHVSYIEKTKHIYSPQTSIDLGFISLTPKDIVLETATVIGHKTTIVKKIDKIEFNVQNDPDKDIYNTLDMLQKIPLIDIGGQDKIYLKGKSNFKVLLNGRPSALLSGDPGMALKMIPAKNILKIEVITSPPSKYDAEGVGGLINIVTKNKTENGYDIYFGTSYNFPYGPLGSFSTNIKSNKLQLSILATTFFQQTPYNAVDKTTNFTDEDNIQQHGEQKFDGNSSMLRSQFLYELDSLNILSLSGSWKVDKFDVKSQIVNIQENTSNYTIFQYGKPFWKTGDVDLNYQRNFKSNAKKFLNLSYKFTSSTNAIDDKLEYKGNNWSTNNQYNEFGFKENAIQVDYENEFKNLLIESGGKFISRNNNSVYTNDQNNKIKFTFNYDVFNLYQTLGFEKGSWSYKGGIRLDIMDFSNKGNSQKNNFNILPSLAIQRSFANFHTLGATYNQRIQRPSISEISPFIDSSNPNFTLSGNPNLKPTKVHSLNFSYTYINKLSIVTDFGYDYTNNSIQQIYSSKSGSLIDISYENIGKERSYDINTNIGYALKKIRFNINGRLSQVNMQSIHKDLPLENDGYEGNMSLSAAIPFSETFRTNISIRYTGPKIFLQGRSNSYFGNSIGFTKQFMNKKLSVFGSINNLTSKNFTKKFFFTTPEVSIISSNQYNYRTFVLSASYSFGSSNLKSKKIKKKNDNSDLNKFKINPLK